MRTKLIFRKSGEIMNSEMTEMNKNKKTRKNPEERNLGPLFFILMICIFLPIGMKFYNAYLEKRMDYMKKVEEEKALRQEINQLAGKNLEMKKQVNFLKSDVGVEEVARNKLGLIKRGEIPFIVTPCREGNATTNINSIKKKENKLVEKKKENKGNSSKN